MNVPASIVKNPCDTFSGGLNNLILLVDMLPSFLSTGVVLSFLKTISTLVLWIELCFLHPRYTEVLILAPQNVRLFGN